MEPLLVANLSFDRNMPLHRQIYEQIRAAILSGRVRSQQKLPASRQLANSLGVSRTTVVQSYDQLISEGYLQTQPGAGTFVCAQIPDARLSVSPIPVQAKIVRSGSPMLSAYGDRLNQAKDNQASDDSDAPDCALSFRYGLPDLNLFPVQQWRRLIGHHLTNGPDWMGYSSDALGDWSLRQQIADYITQVRAVRCCPEQILATSGAQQAIGIIGRLLVNPGEIVALENPGYSSGRRILSASGATVLPIAVDGEGLKLDGSDGLKAKASSPPPRLIYVTPSHQFPTGVSMSLSRRLALLQWAQQVNALIVEDDYDSEFRYSGSPIPALQGLDDQGRVLYVGTFSKVMFPGLQLGYIVVPLSLLPLFRQAKWLSDRQSSLIHQSALADFIREGYLARHVRRMQAIYSRRRQALVAALQTLEAPGAAKILGDRAGLHITARLPVQQDDAALIQQARAQDVSLFSTRQHYWPPSSEAARGEFIFGFGAIDELGIREAIARIQPLLRPTQQRRH